MTFFANLRRPHDVADPSRRGSFAGAIKPPRAFLFLIRMNLDLLPGKSLTKRENYYEHS
jgi:hypothetical protein